jgi:hypothetical protein
MDKKLKKVPNSLLVMGEGELGFRKLLHNHYGIVIGNDVELQKNFDLLRRELLIRGMRAAGEEGYE